MIRYFCTRLAYMLPVVWLVVSVVFLLIHLVPGDPIQAMLGEGAAGADVQAARHAYGLDLPLPTQYVHYWSGRSPWRSRPLVASEQAGQGAGRRGLSGHARA